MFTYPLQQLPVSVLRAALYCFLAAFVLVGTFVIPTHAATPQAGRQLYSVQFTQLPSDKEAIWNFVDAISDLGFPGYVFTEETDKGEVYYYAHMGTFDTPTAAAGAIDALRARLKNPALRCGIVYAGTPQFVPQAELAAMGLAAPPIAHPQAVEDLDFGTVAVARTEVKLTPLRPASRGANLQQPPASAHPQPAAAPSPAEADSAQPTPLQAPPSAPVGPPQASPEIPVFKAAPEAGDKASALPASSISAVPPAMQAAIKDNSFPDTPTTPSTPPALASPPLFGLDLPKTNQPTPPPPSVGRAFVLQIATLRNLAFATEAAAKLRQKGHQPFILKVFDNTKKPWYLLCVGQAPSREQADRLAKVFATQEKTPVTVRSLDSNILSTRRIEF